MTLTPRDKKLLVGLAVFLLIVGVGFGILYPMKTTEQRLATELQEETILMEENKHKINGLNMIQKDKEEAGARLASLSEDYYPVMTSMETEKMITRLSLDKGVVMRDIDIMMPEIGEYAEVADYTGLLMGASSGEENEENNVFPGIYRVEVKMSMTGTRARLQSMLDACQEREPKMQVDEILWQNASLEKNGEYTLAIKVSVYMAEELEEYMDGERGQQE